MRVTFNDHSTRNEVEEMVSLDPADYAVSMGDYNMGISDWYYVSDIKQMQIITSQSIIPDELSDEPVRIYNVSNPSDYIEFVVG